MDAISKLKARLNKDKPVATSPRGPSTLRNDTPKTDYRVSTTSSTAPGSSQQPVQSASGQRAQQAIPVAAGNQTEASRLAQLSPAQPAKTLSPWSSILTSWWEKVHVTVHHHPLHGTSPGDTAGDPSKAVYGWTFITTNLKAVAAGELVMTVRCRPDDAPDFFPEDFLEICDSVSRQAKREHPVLRRWRLLELHKPLFGRADWKAVILSFRNSPIPGLASVEMADNPVPHFYCQPLSQSEAAAARTLGAARVVCGPAMDWFPCVPYVDRDRASSVSQDVMQTSVLTAAESGSAFQRLDVTGLNVLRGGPQGPVTLHVPADRVQWFRLAMMAKREAGVGSLVILSDVHDSCEALMVWQPGQTPKTRTMASRLKNISANFLILSFNQATEALQVVEDGFLVLLGAHSTARFFDAATRGQTLTLPLSGADALELSWPPSWTEPSASKMSRLAATSFQPEGNTSNGRSDPDHVKVDSIRLLREPRPSSLSIKVFAEFQKAAEQAIMGAVPTQKPGLLPRGCGIVARFRVPKLDEQSFSVAVLAPAETQALIMRTADPLAGNEVQDLSNKLGAAVRGLRAPEGLVYGDWIEWEIHFWCWGCEAGVLH